MGHTSVYYKGDKYGVIPTGKCSQPGAVLQGALAAAAPWPSSPSIDAVSGAAQPSPLLSVVHTIADGASAGLTEIIKQSDPPLALVAGGYSTVANISGGEGSPLNRIGKTAAGFFGAWVGAGITTSACAIADSGSLAEDGFALCNPVVAAGGGAAGGSIITRYYYDHFFAG
jgi:hypothetical protein